MTMIFDRLCLNPRNATLRLGIGPWLSVLAVVLASGCSDDGHRPTYPAGGVVKLSDGSPLPGGWIECQLSDDLRAPTAKAAIQSDGRFELGTYDKADGALEGTHRVMIFPPYPPHSRPPMEVEGPPAKIDPKKYPRINAKYRSFDTSGLKFTVTSEPSENRYKIRLEN